MKLTAVIAACVLALAAGPAWAQGKSGEHRPENAGSGGDRNVVALAGGANAAHASPTALEHANSASMVGKIKAYADLEQTLASGELQQAVVDAQAAFDALYPDFDTLSEADRMAALASPEGRALIAAQQALASATEDRDEALAALGPNALDPYVKAYIDSLL